MVYTASCPLMMRVSISSIKNFTSFFAFFQHIYYVTLNIRSSDLVAVAFLSEYKFWVKKEIEINKLLKIKFPLKACDYLFENPKWLLKLEKVIILYIESQEKVNLSFMEPRKYEINFSLNICWVLIWVSLLFWAQNFT